MPDGRTHDDLTLVTASFMTPISLGLVFENNPGQAVLFLGSYLVSGLLFSDDLDISSIEYKRWRLLRVIWLPYQKLVPHRSWLSHGLIVGPLLRILYFAAVLTACLWVLLTALSRLLPLNASGTLGSLLGAIGQSFIDHPDWWTITLAGFVLGGIMHSVADWLWTWWRHAWRAPALADQTRVAEIPTHHGTRVPDFAIYRSENVAETDAQSTD